MGALPDTSLFKICTWLGIEEKLVWHWQNYLCFSALPVKCSPGQCPSHYMQLLFMWLGKIQRLSLFKIRCLAIVTYIPLVYEIKMTNKKCPQCCIWGKMGSRVWDFTDLSWTSCWKLIAYNYLQKQWLLKRLYILLKVWFLSMLRFCL